MTFPTRELKVTIDDFIGPFMEKKLLSISSKISDQLIQDFRKRLIEAIHKEVSGMDLRAVEDDKQLKIVIEDKRS